MENNIKPYGEYNESTKLTEEELEILTKGVTEVETEETKLMKDLKHGKHVGIVGDGVHHENIMEAIVNVSVDTETGLMDLSPVSKENNSATIDDIMNKENDAFFNDLNVSEESFKAIEQTFNIGNSKDIMDFISIIKRYKTGEKFNYYEELPTQFKSLASNMAASVGCTKKEAAKDILNLAVNDVEFEQAYTDLNAMVRKELKLPNMTEMYAEFLQERIEVGFAKKADECEAIGKHEKAKIYRGVIEEFKNSYNLNRLATFVLENKTFVRKLKKELKRWERWVTDFNYKYNRSKFSILDIHLTINAMMRSLETEITLDEAKKVMIVIAKHVQNFDSNSIIDHSYMYYLVYNIISLDYATSGKSPFIDSFKAALLEIIYAIREIEKEEVK